MIACNMHGITTTRVLRASSEAGRISGQVAHSATVFPGTVNNLRGGTGHRCRCAGTANIRGHPNMQAGTAAARPSAAQAVKALL